MNKTDDVSAFMSRLEQMQRGKLWSICRKGAGEQAVPAPLILLTQVG